MRKNSIAPLSRRAVAFVIDVLIYNIIFYPLFLTIFQATSGLSQELLSFEYLAQHQEIVSYFLSALIASTVILCFYMALAEYEFGETIGKHFMGIKVKGKTGAYGYVMRNLLKSTLIFLLPIDLLGLVIYNQRMVDKAIGINVVVNSNNNIEEEFTDVT